MKISTNLEVRQVKDITVRFISNIHQPAKEIILEKLKWVKFRENSDQKS